MTDSGASSYHRYLQGDNRALERLIREYGDSLVRFANSFLGDLSLAEDVMEDTFATLIVKRKPFREEAQFKTYLFRIARNRCLDLLRARKKVVYVEEIRQAPQDDPESEALLSASNKHLYKALLELPKEQREVLELIYFEEFSVTETSQVLHKSRKQIYNYLARAKRNLKDILEKAGFSDEDD